MNYDLQTCDLSAVLAEGRLIGQDTTRTFGQLSAQQINWKPRHTEWSIGQCYDHLIISNRPYPRIIEDIVNGRRHASAWERVPLLPRVFARLLLRTLRPDSGREVDARPNFRPSSSHIEPTIVGTFLEQQDRLLRLMEATRRLDLDGITITSPVVGFITYSLMDAYRIIVAHEQNHFVQASRVMTSPGFPS
jgi:DinB superfamily